MRPLPTLVCAHKPARRSRRAKAAAAQGNRIARVHLRTDALERAAWVRAAGLAGYLSLSDWIRDCANGAAKRAGHASSLDETWNTPADFLDVVRRALGPIALDPCSNEGSIVAARVEWRLERDGDSLGRPWTIGHLLGRRGPQGGPIFVNPPYGRELPLWAQKIDDEARRGAEIVTLVPARTETQWFDLLRERGDAICLRGRLTFLGAQSPALFPSAVFYHGPRGPRRDAMLRAFAPLATMIVERRR